MTSKILEVGDVIEIKEGYNVEALVPRHFAYSNCKGDFTLCDAIVTVGGELSYLKNEYVVTSVSLTGGGTGHGFHDVYPDGHLVVCTSLDNRHILKFYQTGCFRTTIEGVTPIGKATLKWKVE